MSRTYRCCGQKDFWIVDGEVYCAMCNETIGYIPTNNKDHQKFMKKMDKELEAFIKRFERRNEKT